MKIRVPDIPLVYKEELFTICFPGIFRFSYEPTYFDNGGFRVSQLAEVKTLGAFQKPR